MKISGIEKLTLVDYPNKTACLVFTQGCNYQCPFCQNSTLIPMTDANSIDIEEIFTYLEKRINLIDGVCISGGEPLLQADIKDFIKKIKQLGFKVKLDTNGSVPLKLQELLDEKLLNYVAMDIKNDFDNYAITSGIDNVDIKKIKKSIELLKQSNIEYEFRTTITKEFHDIDKIKNICRYIGKDVKYYLQNFQDSSNVFDHNLHSFKQSELELLNKELKKDYPNIGIRGL